jgi:phosphopantetheine--protein transferase-like protein
MNLREIVAKLAARPASEIGPDFGLDGPGLKGSMRKSILIASIRRHLNVECMAAAQAKTFADLEAAVAAAATTSNGATSVAASAAPDPAAALAQGAASSGLACGIDLESVDALPTAGDYAAHEFYAGHFTPAEIAYCAAQTNPRSHFAARWCAKEALKKCCAEFADVEMSDLEVVRRVSGRLALARRGPGGFQPLPHAVSVTHTDALAAAVVVAPRGSSALGWAGVAALMLASALAGWFCRR